MQLGEENVNLLEIGDYGDVTAKIAAYHKATSGETEVRFSKDELETIEGDMNIRQFMQLVRADCGAKGVNINYGERTMTIR